MIDRRLTPEAYSYALESLGASFETARSVPRIRKGTRKAVEVYASHGAAVYFHTNTIKGLIRPHKG